MTSDVRYGDPKNGFVILVAFSVEGRTRQEAESKLTWALPRPKGLARPDKTSSPWLDCWWVAEDDRYDGSDNDPAVFVPLGQQTAWARVVENANGYCPGCGQTNDCWCEPEVSYVGKHTRGVSA